ncbi:MAG: antitoxin family protein [bacterium]|nr:antitoxin family protein [bacterium]
MRTQWTVMVQSIQAQSGVFEMTQVFKAVYENGVIRPLEPLTLADGDRIELRIEQVNGAQMGNGTSADENGLSLSSSEVAELKELSPEERDRIGRKVLGNQSVRDLVNEEREERL